MEEEKRTGDVSFRLKLETSLKLMDMRQGTLDIPRVFVALKVILSDRDELGKLDLAELECKNRICQRLYGIHNWSKGDGQGGDGHYGQQKALMDSCNHVKCGVVQDGSYTNIYLGEEEGVDLKGQQAPLLPGLQTDKSHILALGG
ncbi:hypothetical protein BTVI_138243 [Pitangus sulphuratus]|nr:hypothetical protein BTVI_138243 [Pitangus sulphuratus]